MKTLHYSLLAIAIFISTITVQAASGFQPQHPSKHFILFSNQPFVDVVGPIITVEIGRKKFNCERFGICRTTYDPNIKVDATVPRTARGAATIKGGKLTLDFFRTSMTDETYMVYFGGDHFIMEDDYELPKDVLSILGIKSYTIKAGMYPINLLNDNTLSVTF